MERVNLTLAKVNVPYDAELLCFKNGEIYYWTLLEFSEEYYVSRLRKSPLGMRRKIQPLEIGRRLCLEKPDGPSFLLFGPA